MFTDKLNQSDFDLLNSALKHSQEGRLDLAEPLLAEFLKRHPFEPDVLNHHCDVLSKSRKLPEAYEKAALGASLFPKDSNWHTAASICAGAMGNVELALAHTERAIKVSPYNNIAKWNRALYLLALGRWEEGWKEYECRWANRAPCRTMKPHWDGTYLGEDKTLYLWWEQGLGDTLCMIRFIIPVWKKAGKPKLVIEVQQPLIPLLSSFSRIPTWQIVAPQSDGSFVTEFDEHLPLMSLPHIHGIKSPSELPDGVLFSASPIPPPGIVHECTSDGADTTKADMKSSRIGFCWKGSASHANDEARSLSEELAARFALTLKKHGVEVISLVPGAKVPGIEESEAFQTPHFGYTGQIIAGCDAVVSVDTSVAHLTGSMGKSLIVLTPKAADYRWGMTGEHCFWYPSATLLRQDVQDDWETVLLRAVDRVTGVAVTELEPMPPAPEPERDPHKLEMPSSQFDVLAGDIPVAVGGVPLYRFYYHLAIMLDARNIVETGTYCGAATVYLAAAAKHLGGKLVTIDDSFLSNSVEGNIDSMIVAKNVVKNLDVEGVVRFMDGDSVESLALLADGGDLKDVDLIVLDDDHSAGTLLKELETVWAHLRPGAIVLSHDGMNYHTPGVQVAFKEFARRHGVAPIYLPAFGSVVMLQKPYGAELTYRCAHGWVAKGTNYNAGEAAGMRDFDPITVSGWDDYIGVRDTFFPGDSVPLTQREEEAWIHKHYPLNVTESAHSERVARE